MTTTSGQRRLADLAQDPAVHRAFGWLHLRELQLRRWQLELLAIPAPPFQEADRARWFCLKLRELGLDNAHLDEAGNVVALCRPEVAGIGSKDAVLLSAHLDTVFPPGVPCVPREEDARIYCPGACDNSTLR